MALENKLGITDSAELAGDENYRYMECSLPVWLQESIATMQAAWEKLDTGETYLRWDCDFCNLQTDINNAEVNGIISAEQARYLRTKYLRIEQE